jgi:hypothetical protein
MAELTNGPDVVETVRTRRLANGFGATYEETTELIVIVDRERARRERVEEELESMVWQFANRLDGPKGPLLTTGALSALESAFDTLSWPDPKPVPEMRCEVKKCRRWLSSGTNTADGYKRVCSEHLQTLA